MPAARNTSQHKALANLLREARLAAGLTQTDIAERMKRPQSFVTKVERNERRVDVVEFIEIARAIGVTPESLIKKLQR